jgi:soluble cytochrome b562
MLASQPLPAGPDGTNATEQLHDLVGDDQLYEIIGNLASNDPDANIWDSEELWTRMKELGIDRGVLAPGGVGVQGAEQPQQPTPGSNAPQQTQPVAESGCNATMEGEYCPAHGLAECGSMYEGYSVVPDIDREKYQERSGLEGPFRTKSGKVVYYDKREGKYYDPNTDMYIEYDDWQAMNEGSKETPEKELERLGLRQNAQKNAPLRDQAATQARMRELKKQIVDKKQGMAEDSTDPMDHRGAVTDSFYEDLDRLKKLALNK